MMISLRRSFGSKVFASLFVVLIVLPFTAPLRAVDSDTPIGKPSSSDLKASDDLSDSAALAAGMISAAPILAGEFGPVRMADGCAMRPPVLQLVLRL